MRKLVNFYFKGCKRHIICAKKINTTWTDDKNKYNATFAKAS